MRKNIVSMHTLMEMRECAYACWILHTHQYMHIFCFLVCTFNKVISIPIIPLCFRLSFSSTDTHCLFLSCSLSLLHTHQRFITLPICEQACRWESRDDYLLNSHTKSQYESYAICYVKPANGCSRILTFILIIWYWSIFDELPWSRNVAQNI